MIKMTWEQAVQSLRDQPSQRELVKACYFDDPLPQAAERFRKSDEWRAVTELLPENKGLALDMGAGRGISSYALSHDGWQVTAIEPDPSKLVGAGAINSLAQATGLDITVVSEYSEKLPFANDSFNLVNCRQALHHAHDLRKTCQEIFRVLKPGGVMIATREHVISKREDLDSFLESHALHKFYGGEHAYLLREYFGAIKDAGLHLQLSLGPLDSPINYFPMTSDQHYMTCTKGIAKVVGRSVTNIIFNQKSNIGKVFMKILVMVLNRLDQTPGRLYSFVASKPGVIRH